MLNILLPLDGSELAESAIPHAYAMAKSVAAKVALLRVVSPAEFRNEDAFSRVDWRLRKEQARTDTEVNRTFCQAMSTRSNRASVRQVGPGIRVRRPGHTGSFSSRYWAFSR